MLPDSAGIEGLMAELYFRRKVERGLQDLSQGRVITPDEAKRRLAKWLQK